MMYFENTLLDSSSCLIKGGTKRILALQGATLPPMAETTDLY